MTYYLNASITQRSSFKHFYKSCCLKNQGKLNSNAETSEKLKGLRDNLIWLFFNFLWNIILGRKRINFLLAKSSGKAVFPPVGKTWRIRSPLFSPSSSRVLGHHWCLQLALKSLGSIACQTSEKCRKTTLWLADAFCDRPPQTQRTKTGWDAEQALD